MIATIPTITSTTFTNGLRFAVVCNKSDTADVGSFEMLELSGVFCDVVVELVIIQ